MIAYRPDIDGLRAIAVLSVLIYHAQFSFGNTFFLPGGFLGVDVFFVISGFLISSIILKDVLNRQFSFGNFYMRRARRILPVLLFVITCAIPFAWLHMLSAAFKSFAGSLASSLLFSSNIWFWLEDGYTSEHSLLKPLLHTWSLSVEEQFYIFFPILILLAWKLLRRHFLILLVFIFCASLGFAHLISIDYGNFNFFLLPSRMWELIAGAFLAYFYHVRGVSPRMIKVMGKQLPLALMGLMFIIVPIFTYSDGMRHPSFFTLLPVLGTTLIIWFSHQNDLCTRLLSSKAMIGIGKRSYSLYLWHYPVFAFARIASNQISSFDKISWIAISFALTFFSYRFIEQPARNPNKIKHHPFIFLMLAWVAGLLIFSFVVYKSDGLPSRLGNISNLIEEAEYQPLTQHGRSCAYRPSGSACFFLPPENAPTLINLGDSHGAVLSKALKEVVDRNGLGYLGLTQSACPMILDTFGFNSKGKISNCHPPAQAKRLEKIAKFKNAIIVYNGRLPLYFEGQFFDNQLGGVELGTSSWMTTEKKGGKNPKKLSEKIKESVQALLKTDNTIVLVYPIPEVGWHIPNHIKNELNRHSLSLRDDAFKNMKLTTPYDVFVERSKASYDALNSIGEHKNLIRIYPEQVLCAKQQNECLTHNDTHLFYEDENHLSPYGATLIAEQIEKALFDRKIIQ